MKHGSIRPNSLLAVFACTSILLCVRCVDLERYILVLEKEVIAPHTQGGAVFSESTCVTSLCSFDADVPTAFIMIVDKQLCVQSWEEARRNSSSPLRFLVVSHTNSDSDSESGSASSHDSDVCELPCPTTPLNVHPLSWDGTSAAVIWCSFLVLLLFPSLLNLPVSIANSCSQLSAESAVSLAFLPRCRWHNLAERSLNKNRRTVTVRRFWFSATLLVLLNLLFATLPACVAQIAGISTSNQAHHTCALTTTGAVWCWGFNGDGELGNGLKVNGNIPSLVTAVPTGSNITALAVGTTHTCVAVNGSVLCWGWNNFGQLGNGSTSDPGTVTAVAVVGLPIGYPVVAITAGGFHTCALLSNGAVWCWGQNDGGQLGLGSPTTSGCYCVSSATSAVTLPFSVVSVSAGGSHTCAILSTGTLVCWGWNEYGQLGDGSRTNHASPVTIVGNVVAVSCGSTNTCAVISASAQCWGDNANSQVGDGSTTQRTSPTAVSGLSSGVTAVTVGSGHSCALVSGGCMKCWGSNAYAQLGIGSTADQGTPQTVSGLASGVTAIAAGEYHTCALTAGVVACWGYNGHGEIGDGAISPFDGFIGAEVPSVVVGLPTKNPASNSAAAIVNIVTGSQASHTCALTAVGAAWCWGQNNRGQLGNGLTVNGNIPSLVTVVSPGSVITALALGYGHSCALVNGSALCWGYNSNGQLGNNGTSDSLTAVAVVGLPNGNPVVAISAGGYHTCTLLSNGTLWCWGNNYYGQLGLGYTNNTGCSCVSSAAAVPLASMAVSVSAGNGHTCTILSTGILLCWGSNSNGQLGNGGAGDQHSPVPITIRASAVACGYQHTCAIISGGAQCWGRNIEGEVGDGTTAQRNSSVAVFGLSSGVIAIAAGSYHSCALVSSGGMWCWGYNAQSQLGVGSTTNQAFPQSVSGLYSVVSVMAVANLHTCALLSSKVVCWGVNGDGEIGDGTVSPFNSNIGAQVPLLVVGLPSTSSSFNTSAPIVTIASGNEAYHTCALTAVGAAWCWGQNSDAQLGNGLIVHSNIPSLVTVVPPGSVITALAVGAAHTCGAVNGSVLCWGYNGFGQLGNNGTADSVAAASVLGLPNGNPVVAITAGNTHTCALLSNGAVWCWGRNDYGQLGLGYTNNAGDCNCVSAATAAVELPSSVVSFSAGSDHTCVILSTGTLVCWGSNSNGQLGNGDSNLANQASPATIIGSSTAVACGSQHTCAIVLGGAQCWGDDSNGQLGDNFGSNTQSSVPIDVVGLSSGVIGISVGGSHSCALVSGGGLQCWGWNAFGQLGIGSTNDQGTPQPVPGLSGGVSVVVVASVHTCALTSGVVTCWGYNPDGEIGDGTVSTFDGNIGTMSPSIVIGFPTSSPTSSPSATSTVSGSATASVTRSSTPTASASVTMSVTVTQSSTASVSCTRSSTPTATLSPSASVSPSATNSMSATSTATASSTPSHTESSTVSLSTSLTASNTVSASATVTLTSSYSLSPTASNSQSVTVTSTGTLSASPSVSKTLSATVTLTVTSTYSQSSTLSTSLSETATTTGTSSPSPTTTSTLTGTLTGTSSLLSTVTNTQSTTVTSTEALSASPTLSNTASATLTLTFTSTYSISPSVTNTMSSTLTLTRTLSSSPTVTNPTSASNTFAPSSASATSTHTLSATVTLIGTSSPSSTIDSSLSATVSSSGLSSASPTVTNTMSVSSTVTRTLSPSSTVTSTISTPISFTPSSTCFPSLSVTNTLSASVSLAGTSSPSSTVSISTPLTVSLTSSPSSSMTASNTLSASLSGSYTTTPSPSSTISESSSITATESPTPSLLCPTGCLQCISYNCTLCAAGLRLGPASTAASGGTMLSCLSLLSPASLSCTLPDNAGIGNRLSCADSSVLSLSPEVFALQLDSLTLDGAGVLQPFVAAESTSTGFGIIVGQDLNSPASSSLTLNYVQLPVYVIFASLCEPQSLSAFAPAGQSMDYSACSTTASTIQRFHITVSLVHVDLPPVFMVASFNISASGVGSAGMSIWQPLSYFVTNPDPVYPYNVTSYRVVSGKCNHTSVSASDIVLPVSIWPGNGSLYYTVSGGLGNYSSPMLLCVLAVGGGGLYASANVSLWLSTVQQQLSVQPAYVNVTHYSPGTSSVVVSVAYDPGSTVNGSWGVSVQHPGWSSAVKLSETAFSVVLNSAGLSNSSQSLFVSTALVYTADGSIFITLPITIQLLFGFASLSSSSISQLIRPASTATTTISLFNAGPGVLLFNVPIESRNASFVVDGTSVLWGLVQPPYSGLIPPQSSVILSFLTIGGSLPAAGYSSTVNILTTQPLPSSSDPIVPVQLSGGTSLAVAWTINVLQALVFPLQQMLTVVPNQTATVLTFAVANFAGSPIQVNPQNNTLPDWMTLSLESDVVQNGNMVGLNITVVYPTVSVRQLGRETSSLCHSGTLPNTVGPDVFTNVSMGINAWRLPPGTTSQSLFSVDDSAKVSLPIMDINIPVTTALGDPSALYSCVVPPDVTNCTVGDTVSLAVEVRDVGGTLVPFSADASGSIGMSVSCNYSEACQQIYPGAALADIVNVLNTTAEGVFLVEVQALATGPLLLQMSIRGMPVGDSVPLFVLGITCPPHQVTLDGITCICTAGYYVDVHGHGNSTLCQPCPAGTYNPTSGSIGSSSCRHCPVNHFCLSASVNATGKCPSGFDCSSGSIVVPIGYWSPYVNVTAASDVSNAVSYPCFSRVGCVGGSASVGAACATGYIGPLCSSCAPGWAGLAGVCQRCMPTGVLAFGLGAVALLLALSLGLAVAIILQDGSHTANNLSKMQYLSLREALFGRLRVVFDSLQVIGLLLSLSTSDRTWFTSSLLSLTGASLGMGLGVTSWSPWLCLMPSSPFLTVVYTQVGILCGLIPLAALAAYSSVPLAYAMWKQASSKSHYRDRFVISLSVLLYISYFGVLHTAFIGSISRKDSLSGSTVLLADWREPISDSKAWTSLWLSRSLLSLCGLLVVTVLIWLSLSKRVRRARGSAVSEAVPHYPHALRALTLGYKWNKREALFEALLVLRKWGLLAAGVGFVDPLWSLVVAILCFCALWMGVVRVKPFATKGGQLHFRIAQTLLLILMLILLLELSDTLSDRVQSALEVIWMVALFACLAIDARFTMAVLSDLRKARLVTQVTRTRLKSWRPQTSGVSFARSQQVQAMMGGAVKGGEEKEKEKEQGIEPGKPEDW